MKFSLGLALGMGWALSGCEDLNRPISATEFDPMMSPAMRARQKALIEDGFKPGQFVSAIMDNTAFFAKKPDGGSEADRLLSRGTSMKVISASGSYSKVELDSGEVGYVPSIMLEDPNAPVGMDFDSGNPYDSYPLQGDFEAMPDLPAGGTPPSGAVPALNDPSAPVTGNRSLGIDSLPALPLAAEGVAGPTLSPESGETSESPVAPVSE